MRRFHTFRATFHMAPNELAYILAASTGACDSDNDDFVANAIRELPTSKAAAQRQIRQHLQMWGYDGGRDDVHADVVDAAEHIVAKWWPNDSI